MAEVAVVPRIRYPRDACVGLTYLMTVDLDHSVPPEAWPYAEEEYPVTCFLDAGSLFEHEPIGDRTIVVHRFGGSYGPAVFRLRAHTAASGTIRVILVDRVGVPIAVVPLDEIEVRNDSPPVVVPVAERIADLGHVGPPPEAFEKLKDIADDKPVGRALLVGVGEKLLGVDNDIQSMAEMLLLRGFKVDVCPPLEATRDGILARYSALIANADPHQAAVFYYSGPAYYSFVESESGSLGVIPGNDYKQSSDNDFRGITTWELSILEAQLTQRTTNVTVILDCSHAAQMSRVGAIRDAESTTDIGDAVPRGLPHPVRLGFAAHLRALRTRYGTAFDAVDPLGNPHAVRLVACGPNQQAFEYTHSDGRRYGAFTKALLDVLNEVGDVPISWASIEGAIRLRVLRKFAFQRPDIEGPVRRRVFSLREEPSKGAVTIAQWPEGFRIDAGRLMGVTAGDVYGVMALGSPRYHVAQAIAEVRVNAAFASFADADLVSWQNGHNELPQNAMAILIKRTAARRPVKLDVPDEDLQILKAEIEATPTLRLAEPYEERVLSLLRLTNGALTIEDALGPLFSAAPYPVELGRTVQNLENLAAAEGLRELEGEHGVLANEVEIEWGAVDRGQMQPLPELGASLTLRDRVYVKVKSKVRTLYAHIFSLGVRGKITLLTAFAPSGVELTTAEAELVLGRRSDGALLGLGLILPSDLPLGLPRIGELVVIVTSNPTSLRGLETEERIIARNVEPDPEDIDGFFVKRLGYFLHPRQDIAFVIDEEPERQDAAQVHGPGVRDEGDEPAPDDLSRAALDLGLVIGIENYPHFRSLRGAANDARSFHDWLCDASGGGLHPENVRLILSDAQTMKPSQDDIDDKLGELLHTADLRGGGRRLYFYFSGHGATGLTQSAHDITLLLTGWSTRLTRSAVSAERYSSLLRGTGLFEEIVMFIDCCRDVSISVTGMEPTLTEMWKTRPSKTRMFFAYATEGGQPAFESKESDSWQGLFTRCLLSILQRSNGVRADKLGNLLERELDNESGLRGFSQRAYVVNGLSPESRFGVGRTSR